MRPSEPQRVSNALDEGPPATELSSSEPSRAVTPLVTSSSSSSTVFSTPVADLSRARNIPGYTPLGSNQDVRDSRFEQGGGSPTSTAQTSRSPTPELSCDEMLDAYMDRLNLSGDDDDDQNERANYVLGERERLDHINDLPLDVLTPIFSYLETPRDILSAMLTQKRWLAPAATRLWYRPVISTMEDLHRLAAVVSDLTPSIKYAQLVHRLTFMSLAESVTDDVLEHFSGCTNIDRLTLARCNQLSAKQLAAFVSQLPRLQSIDLSDVNNVDDEVLRAIAGTNRELQVYYGSGSTVSDAGLNALGELGGTLRRLTLSKCDAVSPEGVVALTTKCRHLVELDVTRLTCFKPESAVGFTDEHVASILRGCPTLRDLHLDGSATLTQFDTGRVTRMDTLRNLSLAMCSRITDESLLQLVQVAPRIRHLNLSKCPLITDRGVATVAEKYGQALQHLHLGHCSLVTDRAVAKIVECCPRLTFFDAANCSNLTNMSLIKLAKLSKLRRIGVVKCNEIGSPGVEALAASSGGDKLIERLHLSYCSSISIHAIKQVLVACPRLVHLSLTGVRAFMRPDITRLSRPPPPELNQHQRQMFCVFSGSGIAQLRDLLQDIDPANSGAPTPTLAAPFGAESPDLSADLPPEVLADLPPEVLADLPPEVLADEELWIAEMHDDPEEIQAALQRQQQRIPQHVQEQRAQQRAQVFNTIQSSISHIRELYSEAAAQQQEQPAQPQTQPTAQPTVQPQVQQLPWWRERADHHSHEHVRPVNLPVNLTGHTHAHTHSDFPEIANEHIRTSVERVREVMREHQDGDEQYETVVTAMLNLRDQIEQFRRQNADADPHGPPA